MPKLLPKAVASFQDARKARRNLDDWEASSFHRRHRVLIADWVGKVRSVADLGCGDGCLVDILDCEVYYGYDSSDAMLAAARLAHPGESFCKCNILSDSPAGLDTFDVVVLCGVAPHFDEPLQVVLEVIRHWSAKRYIFSLIVGDFRENLYSTTVVSFSEFVGFLDSVRLLRLRVERFKKERFALVLVEGVFRG